jgi:tetratricopeptide (TPR) repeat protein
LSYDYKKCPRCMFNVPSAASVCGHCGADFAQIAAAHAAAQEREKELAHEERLRTAESMKFTTYPAAGIAGLAVAAFVYSWDIGWGWKAFWLLTLPGLTGKLVFEYLLPALSLLLGLGMIVGVIAGIATCSSTSEETKSSTESASTSSPAPSSPTPSKSNAGGAGSKSDPSGQDASQSGSALYLPSETKTTIKPEVKTSREESAAPKPVPAVSGSPCTDIDACVAASLKSAQDSNLEEVRRIAGQIEHLEKPALGNKAVSRKLNAEGLTAFAGEDYATAARLFKEASQENPLDAEVAANYGFALLKLGRAKEATPVLKKALLLDPRRVSTWTPLGEALALSDRSAEGVAALWIAYQWSSNREKAVSFFETRAEQEKGGNQKLAVLYAKVLERISKNPD